MTWPLVDAITMKLTCMIIFDSGHHLSSYIDMRWTGIGLKKSLWVKQSDIRKGTDYFELSLNFNPWLNSHAGEYTCHFAIKDKGISIFTLNKTFEVKGKYHIRMD